MFYCRMRPVSRLHKGGALPGPPPQGCSWLGSQKSCLLWGFCASQGPWPSSRSWGLLGHGPGRQELVSGLCTLFWTTVTIQSLFWAGHLAHMFPVSRAQTQPASGLCLPIFHPTAT